MEVPVRIVFDDDDVEALTEGVDGATASKGEGATGRVLADGDGVHDVWTAALDARVPALEDVAEAAGAVGADTLGIHSDVDDADAVGRGSLYAVRVGEILDEHVVAAFAEEGDGFAETIGVAARQQDLGVAVRDAAAVQVVQRKVGDEGRERRQSGRIGVLQRGDDIHPGTRGHGGRGGPRDRDMGGRVAGVGRGGRLFGTKGGMREEH